MPAYGGVTLLQCSPETAEWIEHNISLADVSEFAPAPRLAKLNIRMPYPDIREMPIKIGTLWWPQGASRWSVGHFLASESQLTAIRAAGGGTTALPLVMADGTGMISPSLWMLPPRPLAQSPPDVAHLTSWALPVADLGTAGNPIYLITLVDDRFQWWDLDPADPFAILITEGVTTWQELFTAIGSALDVTLTVGTIPSGYLFPPAALSAYQEYLPLLLDLAATAVGQRVVRNLDGTVQLQEGAAALAAVNAGLAANVTNRMAGGLFAAEDLVTNLPAFARVVFPAMHADVLKGTPYFPADFPLGGPDGTKILRSSAVAAYDETGTLTNAAELGVLAALVAEDYEGWQGGGFLDAVFAGICPWAPEALDTIEWTNAGIANTPEAQCSTRVMREEWNSYPDLLHAGTPWQPWMEGSIPNWWLFGAFDTLDAGLLWVREDLIYSGSNFNLPHAADVYTATLPSYGRAGNIITFAGAPTIAGVVMTVGRRVLYDPGIPSGLAADAGLYVFTGALTMQRVNDASTSAMVRAGMLVQVGPEGTSNANTLWQLVTANPIVLNTTPLDFQLLAPGGGSSAAATGIPGAPGLDGEDVDYLAPITPLLIVGPWTVGAVYNQVSYLQFSEDDFTLSGGGSGQVKVQTAGLTGTYGGTGGSPTLFPFYLPGPPGPAGEDGEDSLFVPGLQGLTGAQGGQGFPGYTGPPGMTGDDGEDGVSMPGIPGPTGTRGLQGYSIPGQDGDQGEDGAPMPGIPGPVGAIGLTGAIGMPGLPGMPGEDGEDGTWASLAGSGVTSVALQLPFGEFVVGGPVTGSGTLVASWVTQASGNLFLASPGTGPGAPSFRFIVPLDLGSGPANSGTVLYGDMVWRAAGAGSTASPGIPGPPGDDGEDGYTIPGAPGARGLTGPPGGLGPPGTDGEDSDGTIMVLTTPTTATGPQIKNTVYAGPITGTPATPTFRLLDPSDMGAGLANSNSWLRGDQQWVAIAIGLSLPVSLFTVTVASVTPTGTLTAVLASQTQNQVFCAPAAGGAGVPTFRFLVALDLGIGSAVTTKFLRGDMTWQTIPGTSVMIASGALHASGLTPDTPSTAGTTKYLREDATWYPILHPPSVAGTNIQGTSWFVFGGQGTGSAGGGDLVFNVALPGTPGTGVNPEVQVMKISGKYGTVSYSGSTLQTLITPLQYDDWARPPGKYINLTTDCLSTLPLMTGMVAGDPWEEVTIIVQDNPAFPGSAQINFSDEDPASAAANRFFLNSGATITVSPGASLGFVYDGIIFMWRLIFKSP